MVLVMEERERFVAEEEEREGEKDVENKHSLSMYLCMHACMHV